MAVDNHTILHNIWLNATNDYQQRIPEPTQSNISAVMQALFDPMNKQYYNQFIDALVMRIGDTFVHQQTFRNPLAIFKGSRMMYGNTLQEIIPKWIRAHSYVDDAEDVFKMARPDVGAWYHSQNRRDRYDITINRQELRTAFTEDYGLNRLISAIMNVPMNSDEYDEYRIMLQLIAEYDRHWGFFKHALTAAPTDEASGKEFLYWLRAYAKKLQFPSTTYNNEAIEDIPIFVEPNELVILMTPETQAAIDVFTLASVFQLDKADIQQRIVIVDEFPIANDDCVAILTTRDFFMCRDTEYENTSIYNPKTLSTNYFLHHWGIYSVSPFVPAIMFTVGGESTTIETVTQSVTGITLTPNSETVEPGDELELVVNLTGTLNPNTDPFVKVAPDAATYDVSVTRTEGEGESATTTAINSPRTRVDEYGILHVSNRLESGDIITVIATATYTNPSGVTNEYTATGTYTVA
jgi:hypothetical protein